MADRRTILRTAAAAILLSSPGEAAACLASSFFTALIHDALPTPLPEGAIVAEVAFESEDERAVYAGGVRARVIRMVQGHYRGGHLIVRRAFRSSCSHPFLNGTSGLLVARAAGMEQGVLVVDPIEVSRSRGFRLEDRYRLPPMPSLESLRQWTPYPGG